MHVFMRGFSLLLSYKVLFVFIFIFFVHSAHASVKRLIHPSFQQVAQDCQITPQVHVNSLSGYIRALELSNWYRHDNNMSFLPLCIDLPIKISSYECAIPVQAVPENERFTVHKTHKASQRRAHCHNLTLSPGSQNIIMTEQTKAYVRGAQMFLSENVAYSTFIHELAHFAFFAEEYPMRDELKTSQCRFPQDRFSAPNMWASPKGQVPTQYASKHPFTDLYKRWLKDEPQLAKYVHQACSSTTHNWYTLVPDKFTFLRYNDITYIPSVYKYMWQAQIRDGRVATYH